MQYSQCNNDYCSIEQKIKRRHEQKNHQFNIKYKETTYCLSNVQNKQEINVRKTCKPTENLLLDCLCNWHTLKQNFR